MSDKPKVVKISWEDLQDMGNPQNAPEIVEEQDDKSNYFKTPIKVHYERKGRGGKEAIVIRGLIMINPINQFITGNLTIIKEKEKIGRLSIKLRLNSSNTLKLNIINQE